MRGKRLSGLGPCLSRRNIPAYAGKTDMSFSHDGLLSEHPRVCGENRESVHLVGDLFGTSPRMRGKQKSGRATRRCQRNIPAYAGKTTSLPWLLGLAQEHPRVCGENEIVAFAARETAGTSPRMRGKLLLILPPPNPLRNIPAYAGKTRLWRSPPEKPQEHPRVCGENYC